VAANVVPPLGEINSTPQNLLDGFEEPRRAKEKRNGRKGRENIGDE